MAVAKKSEQKKNAAKFVQDQLYAMLARSQQELNNQQVEIDLDEEDAKPIVQNKMMSKVTNSLQSKLFDARVEDAISQQRKKLEFEIIAENLQHSVNRDILVMFEESMKQGTFPQFKYEKFRSSFREMVKKNKKSVIKSLDSSVLRSSTQTIGES